MNGRDCKVIPTHSACQLADVHLYKQLGNSVSVPVIKAIAENIKIVLLDNSFPLLEWPITRGKVVTEYVLGGGKMQITNMKE